LANQLHMTLLDVKVNVKILPYSLPSVGPGADPGVLAVKSTGD